MLLCLISTLPPAACHAGDVVRDRGLELLLSRLQRPPGVVEVDATLAKVLAGHLLLEAALEQDEAAAAAAAGRSGGGGILSDSDSTDSEGEEGQPFTARSTAGAIPAERAGRLAKLQLALDAPPSDVVQLLIMYCLEASAPAGAYQAGAACEACQMLPRAAGAAPGDALPSLPDWRCANGAPAAHCRSSLPGWRWPTR